MPSSESTAGRVRLAPRAWLPLVFVVIALILLFGTPLIVSYRVRYVRNNLSDVADQARVAVDEFEAAFATELLALRSNYSDAARADSISAAAVRMERKQERALDSLVVRLGPDAVERVVLLRTAEQRWRETNRFTGRTVLRDQIAGSDARDGREVLSSAESLDRYLVRISDAAREEVRRLERMNVYFAGVLAPIALIAVAIVFMLDRRMRRFAHEADDRAVQLQRSLELRATLIRGVTHDIKNPLGAASGYADLLEDGLAGTMNAQQTEMVRRLKRLVGTAQQTVTELLELARADGGELSLDRRDTDIASTVREVVSGYEAGATQKQIALTLDTPGDPPPVSTDATRVRHIVENLVSNAIKYTPPGGVVAVGITTTNGDGDTAPQIRVSVRDNGPGIPAAFRERVFDEFFRVPSSEGLAAGTGLGLAISRRVARLLGGDITFTDAPEHGSVFTLALPLSRQ